MLNTETARKSRTVYSNKAPWTDVGTKILGNLPPMEVMEQAGLDWSVEKYPTFYMRNGETLSNGRSALVREDNGVLMDTITDRWHPVQNAQAFDFFTQFVAAGDLDMQAAGQLDEGRMVWALAKINEQVEIVRGDIIQSFVLFTNPHRYGSRTDIQFSPQRACNSSRMVMNMRNSANRILRSNHSKPFNITKAIECLGYASSMLQTYAEQGRLMASKRAKGEDIETYLKRVFPMTNGGDDLSRSAKAVQELIETQPGAKYGRGTWWPVFNAVTHYVDHEQGRGADTRVKSSWFGQGAKAKAKALQLAVAAAKAGKKN